MGVLGSSLLDNSGLPTPLYLPRQVYVDNQRESQQKKFSQLTDNKFGSTPEFKKVESAVPVSLFFSGNEYGIEPGKDATQGVGAIVFTLILKESHSLSATVSEHPVENGSPVSDHIQNGQREGSFTGLVSNFSIFGVRDAPPNAAKHALDLLTLIWKDRKLVSVNLGLASYEDVAITNVSASRDGSSGDAQEFEISFKQVKKVELRAVSIGVTVTPPPKMDTKKRKQAAVKVDRGAEQGEEIEESEEPGAFTDA